MPIKDGPPDVPYFDLPAGLMVPLVKMSDCEYKEVDPQDIRLPPPTPPSEKLIKAVEAFYAPVSTQFRDAFIFILTSFILSRRTIDRATEKAGNSWHCTSSSKRKQLHAEKKNRIRKEMVLTGSRAFRSTKLIRAKGSLRSVAIRKTEVRGVADIAAHRAALAVDLVAEVGVEAEVGAGRLDRVAIGRATAVHGRDLDHVRGHHRHATGIGTNTDRGAEAHRRSHSCKQYHNRLILSDVAFFRPFSQSNAQSKLDASNKGHKLLEKMGWKGSGKKREQCRMI